MMIRQVETTTQDYETLKAFRNTWLRVPLGLNLFEEDLSDDDLDIMIAAFEQEEMIGCVMLHPIESSNFKLRQMAVDERLRGKGIGAALIQHAEATAREHKASCIILHARLTAQSFYEKLGYEPYGNIFTEVTVPHIAMKKFL